MSVLLHANNYVEQVSDIVIPSSTKEHDAVLYLADIYHELATPKNPEVKVIG